MNLKIELAYLVVQLAEGHNLFLSVSKQEEGAGEHLGYKTPIQKQIGAIVSMSYKWSLNLAKRLGSRVLRSG